MIAPEECLEKAIEAGLDAICITEHGTLEGAREMKSLASKYKEIKVFAGMEVAARECHILVFGYSRDMYGNIPAREVVRLVEAEGGIAIAAHPWRFPFGWFRTPKQSASAEADFNRLFKVIEMYNGYSTPNDHARAEGYCRRYLVPGTGGSDAHSPEDIGAVVTQFVSDIENEEQLVKALKSGSFVAKLRKKYYELHGSISEL